MWRVYLIPACPTPVQFNMLQAAMAEGVCSAEAGSFDDGEGRYISTLTPEGHILHNYTVTVVTLTSFTNIF